jgi:hypothetical protein
LVLGENGAEEAQDGVVAGEGARHAGATLEALPSPPPQRWIR